jgi:hypothetical protein
MRNVTFLHRFFRPFFLYTLTLFLVLFLFGRIRVVLCQRFFFVSSVGLIGSYKWFLWVS